jgi:hypothetical protein
LRTGCRRRFRRFGNALADHEVGLAPAEPDLDARVGQPGGDLGGGIGERFEQGEPGGRFERVTEQLGGARGLRAARRRGGGEIGSQGFEVRRQVHVTTMTSRLTSVKCHDDVYLTSQGRP